MKIWLRMLLLLIVMMGVGGIARGEEGLDFSKAVKIGSGPTVVVEFTDPDCPYCRKAEQYFKGRRDVTRYVFFFPLKSHPASKGKVQYILSAKDRVQAYEQVVAGIWDRKNLEQITPEGVKLQEEHLAIAKSLGIRATPSFVIYSRIIVGFKQQQIEELIKK